VLGPGARRPQQSGYQGEEVSRFDKTLLVFHRASRLSPTDNLYFTTTSKNAKYSWPLPAFAAPIVSRRSK
jgi:hypothetical protein